MVLPVQPPPRWRRVARLAEVIVLAVICYAILAFLYQWDAVERLRSLENSRHFDKNPELLPDTNANGNRDPMLPDQQQQCLGLDPNQGNTSQDMDSLVASASQIFVTMPAKAGGSSMKVFTKRCMKNEVADNILTSEELWKDYLVNS